MNGAGSELNLVNPLIIDQSFEFVIMLFAGMTIMLFYGVSHWNSWFDTYLYASSNEKLSTLQYELQKILSKTQASAAQASGSFTDQQAALTKKVTPRAIQMAITMVVTVPIVCVYPFLQKYFVKGMTLGSVKA